MNTQKHGRRGESKHVGRGMRAGALLALVAACSAGCATTPKAIYPITDAQGLYTIRVAFFHDVPKEGKSSIEAANEAALALRRNGHEAYVTYLGPEEFQFSPRAYKTTTSMVTVGSFGSKDDPKLIEVWRRFYVEWQKQFGQTTLGFHQRELERFYDDPNIPIGSRPWPVPIPRLQLRMKEALGTATDQDRYRYNEYLRKLHQQRERDRLRSVQ